jgi:hypothetical protein
MKPFLHGRRLLSLAALALAGSTAFLTWWWTTLMGLPDIGDPFDVAAFAPPIPDEANAFVLYREAFARLVEAPDKTTGLWPSAGPEERRWFDQSREALDLWRRGTGRPDALYISPHSINVATLLPVIQGLRSFSLLATLEGTRLEAEGNLDGALDWYIAILRSSRHCGKKGIIIERLVASGLGSVATARILAWLKDPQVEAASLRRLLAALIEADAMTPPASDSIKAEYLMMIRSFGDPAFDDPEALIPSHALPPAWTTGPGRTLVRLVRRIKTEPERSRRVSRLIVANWLAYCDRPKSTRPTLGTVGPSSVPLTTSSLLLYPIEPDAPADLKRLTTAEIDRWYESSLYLRFMFGINRFGEFRAGIDADRLAIANLIVTIASELWKKERGQYPSRPEDLVGPYLKSLPEAYLSAPLNQIRTPPAAGIGPAPRPRL